MVLITKRFHVGLHFVFNELPTFNFLFLWFNYLLFFIYFRLFSRQLFQYLQKTNQNHFFTYFIIRILLINPQSILLFNLRLQIDFESLHTILMQLLCFHLIRSSWFLSFKLLHHLINSSFHEAIVLLTDVHVRLMMPFCLS